MTRHIPPAGLEIAPELQSFVETRLLPGLALDAPAFWSGLAAICAEFMPRNRALLERRDQLQAAIDGWHQARRGQAHDPAAYRAFLTEIGYLQPAPGPFAVDPGAVDPEIATMAGPQLVVPVSNARFALNAANARWGSLYDALYGSDVLGPVPGPAVDAVRRQQVVVWAADFLDRTFPLETGSHADVIGYQRQGDGLAIRLGGGETRLADPAAFIGGSEEGSRRTLYLRHNGLHVALVLDPKHPVGAASASGLCDVLMEAALTAIQDCEDSVAAVDAADKVQVYGNWLGLMKGDLAESFVKNGATMTRRLAQDRAFTGTDGQARSLTGRALLLVRNVGLLMTTDTLRWQGQDIPEGILDAMITVTAALHDLPRRANSRCGAVYVVKPKLHGPEEAAFTDALFTRVEEILGLPANSVKLGLMDEERRTSVNLAACIHALRNRIVFINTGFLDRTGDEIHTSMQAGPMLPRAGMRQAIWLSTYEDGNVRTGLAAGMKGRGQIGKGMWAKPDAMAEMLEQKIGHPMAGASTAWVPSPTAATLHALHYHQVDVAARQAARATEAPAALDDLLTPPLLQGALPPETLAREVDNCCQGILGYVVRWVDQGVGCSKVPDIDDVPLMEDRATCRISAQYLANWLVHGLTDRAAVEDSLRRMAARVDRQNAGDAAYRPMAPGFDGPAFRAAAALIFEGATQPSGYTEPLLHAHRREVKSLIAMEPKTC